MQELARRELTRRQQSMGQSGEFAGPVPTGEELAASRAPKTEAAMRRLGLLDVVTAAMPPMARTGFGIGEAALTIGSGMVSSPANSFFNAAMEANRLPPGQPVGTYQPRTKEGEAIVKGVDRTVRMTGIPWLLEKGLDLDNPDPGTRATGHAIAGALGVLPAVGPLRAARARRAMIPTRAEIKAAANDAYARAEQAGGMLPQNELGGFVQRAEQMLSKESFDVDQHPQTNSALKKLYEEATRPGVNGHSPQGAEIIRRRLLDAEKDALIAGKGEVTSDARLAGKLLDDFDDFMDQALSSATAEYRTARNLWSVQRKTQDIEQLIERAKNQAGGYSVSGMENALRTQFRTLADNPRRFNRFSPEERAAILRVARNGLGQYSLRLLGKAAPTGNVSWLTILAAEGVAPGSGLGLAALGITGRAGASALRSRNARRVDELVRSGAIPSMPVRPGGNQPLPQLGFLPANALAVQDREVTNALRDDRERRNALTR